ncbi:MAG: GTP-binding protein [Promethearchaeota archaeon]|nr:MAG: GTP-binding protein [Candidatus Lokiarchaeota archaeon]
MEEYLIYAIVYTEIDDEIGPTPIIWEPSDLSEDILIHIGIKSITLLTAEQGYIPESIVVIPFPSIGLKGIIKYLQYGDEERRGGVGQAAITLLFSEVDDLIFYKGMEEFESVFDEIAQNVIKIEETKQGKEHVLKEVKKLREDIKEILNDLRIKEVKQQSAEAFPEKDIEEKGKINLVYKVIVCGDPMVGKTSTILRFTESAFDRKYIPSIGINVSDKVINIKNANIQLILWDIAGQSKFQTMRSAFYKGARGVLLIFDLTNPKSFENLKKWHEDIKKHLDIEEKLVGFILGNKSDKVEQRQVSFAEAKKLADELNLEYYEISALTGSNVNKVFYNVAESLSEKHL